MFKLFQFRGSTEAEEAVSSVSLQRRALEQLHDMLALLPLQQQTAYREALAICPSLVETESNSMQFLLYTDFNALNAATRLVTYWEKRKEVFGERAFLPILDLSGNGALSPEDVKLIRTGSFMLTAEDTVVVDRSLEPVEFSSETQVRRTFFFHQLLARHRVNAMHDKGCHFVVQYRHSKMTDTTAASKSSEISKDAFPIRIKAVHVVFAAEYQVGFLRNAVSFLASSHFMLHHCDTPEQALLKLIPHGVIPSSLPPTLGGTYQSDIEFDLFLTQLGFSVTTLQTDHDHLSLMSSPHAKESKKSTDEYTSSTQDIADKGEEAGVRKLKSLNEAIDVLPESDKAAYMQAIRVAPGLVEEESPPLLFLEFEASDAWAAATRLCKYWEYRLEIFEDRAFLPMTIDGAMGHDGKAALELGTQYLLRNGSCGRSVWCGEPLLKLSSDPKLDLKMRVKVLFYVVSKVIKNPVSIHDGFIGVPMVSRIEIPIIDSRWRANIVRGGEIIKESFPVRPITTQIIFIPSGWNFLIEFCYKFLIHMFTSLFGYIQNIHFCVGTAEREQLERTFEEIGISREGLPKIVGGQDGPSEFLARQRQEENWRASKSIQEVPKSVFKDMQTALSLIPSENKAAYMEALSKAPELAEQESLWESFLRFTRSDASKAADMFVKYWEVRKELFGNRAFLPVNQTFEGALERKDVAVLQTGYFMQLPCVESGESVLYCDGTKLQKSSSGLSRARCKFYMLSIMAENPASQTRGFNLLYFLSDPSFDRVFKNHFFERLLPVMPVRLNQVYFLGLDISPTGANVGNRSVETRMNHTTNMLDFRREAGASSVESHVCASREDLLKKLARHGFRKEGLPKTVFGEMGYDGFVKWQELRIRYEWGLFTNSRELEISSRYLIPRNKLLLHEEECEKAERKRRMTIILSRRKRERERMSFEELQEEAMEQRERNRKLRRLNETLQELIEKAKEIANTESPS